MADLIVRSKVKPEHVTEVDAAVERMFRGIASAKPQGIRYSSYKLADGVTYLAVLHIDEGVVNPLPTIPEFQEFQTRLAGWIAEAPQPEPATVVGHYS